MRLKGLNSDGQFCNQSYSKYARKALVNVGPKGESHSISLFVDLFIKDKIEFFHSRRQKSLKFYLTF